MSLMIRSLIISSIFSFLALPLLIFSGCTDPITDENNQLLKEILTVHDGAMEKIDLLYELQKRLKSETACSSECEAYINTLQRADEAMFDWMHQYLPLPADNDLEEDTRYRRQQLEQIKEVRRLMEKAIIQAETYLKRSARIYRHKSEPDRLPRRETRTAAEMSRTGWQMKWRLPVTPHRACNADNPAFSYV